MTIHMCCWEGLSLTTASLTLKTYKRTRTIYVVGDVAFVANPAKRSAWRRRASCVLPRQFQSTLSQETIAKHKPSSEGPLEATPNVRLPKVSQPEVHCQDWIRVMSFDVIGVRLLVMWASGHVRGGRGKWLLRLRDVFGDLLPRGEVVATKIIATKSEAP